MIITAVTHRLIKEYRAGTSKHRFLLFVHELAFNFVTFAAVFGLFFMCALKLQSVISGTERSKNKIFTTYHSIFVLFYGKQNCLMLLVMYLRLYYIFKDG